MIINKQKEENDAMEVDDEHSGSRDEEIQELEQKNSELQARINECSQERDTFRMLLDEKEDQVKQSEEILDALRTENQNICNENNILKIQLDDLSSLRTETTNLRDEQKNNSNEISNLKAQLVDLSSLRTENANLRDEQKNNSNEINKLKAQLESENERLKNVQNEYETENNDLRDKLSSFRTENKKLRNGQKNDSSNLKAQLENLTATLRAESEKYEVMCGEHDKLKIHLENEKLKNKNIKQNNHLTVYNDYANLKYQVKELKKSNEKLTNMLTESKENLEKILTENKTLKDKISTSFKSPNNYSEQFEDKLKEKPKKNDQLDINIKIKNGEIGNFQNKSNELEDLQKKNEEYVKEISNINKLLQKKEKEKQDLIEKNASLKKEASQYQSALGTMTNYRMDDDDKNHSVQLKKDIEELQNKLKNYVTTLKGDFEIDFNAINDLMKNYSIKTKVTLKNPNKPLIKAFLQHHIIKTIRRDIRKYFKQNSKEDSIMHLEKEIATKAKDLENNLAYFSKTRSGNDTITQAASIKVRQEVNIALGNRGFSNVLSGENYTSHGYIIFKAAELNKEMNKYRMIKDENKRNYVEKLAPDLIREFIRIFQFRLKVQEPRAQMRWINTESSIDPSIMEGNWDKDDIDNLEVEICSFPMVGRDLDDGEKRKIYTHAQIFTKRKKLYTKGIDYLTSKKAKVYLEPESDDDGVECLD